MTTTASSVTEAAALGAAVSNPQIPKNAAGHAGIPFVTIPAGYVLADLEKHFSVPARKRGTVAFRDAASFCAAVASGKSHGTTLYSNPSAPSFTCVFNDHGDEPGWRDHVATYACPKSVEWLMWVGMNKKQMTQVDFAQFIEDNAPDCVVPEAATMIEISRSLQAKKGVSFASGIRLDNGQTQFKYEETINGTAGSKGQLTIPETFSIGIAVLEGGPKYQVHARLRYRISDAGVLTMWFDLERPHKVLEDAAKEVLAFIEKMTGMPVLNGG